jgi:2-oxoglutarate/2-oxoacid ferredoxin oxidoreductase subunit alpha
MSAPEKTAKPGTQPIFDSVDHPTEELDITTVRFAGDSGDGMQVLGTRFANTSAIFGEDVMTLAEYPAEIRAPAGTLHGVSGFQMSIGPQDVYTAGDQVDVLVAMNPAALKTNLPLVRPNGIIIANVDSFTEKNLAKANYTSNPLDNHDLDAFRVFPVSITRLTNVALSPLGLPVVQIDRSKNFFALGLICWLFNLPIENSLNWIDKKFKSDENVRKGNTEALIAGNKYGESAELFTTSYVIKKPETPRKPGTYRYLNGNSALAMGLIAAADLAGLKLFLGSYPITPASDILHELSRHKEFPVTTFQAEDEIAAIGAALGASFAGSLAVTTTSGPGMALKTEFINLAVSVELPLIIVNVQRGGPSTGLPTKMEQADLYQALWSRHGESPAVVLAAKSPSDCFATAIEAAQIAIKYMTPVIILSDGYIANGSEPWHVPEADELPEIKATFLASAENFRPYARNSETLARPWITLGTPGMQHVTGGLEKNENSGHIDLTPENHQKMVNMRAEKINRVRNDFAPLEIHGDPSAELLIVGWGSTYGAILRATMSQNTKGHKVASIHLRHLNPFPRDLEGILRRFPKVVVAENNLGQLWTKLRAEYLVDADRLNKVKGTPFKISEIEEKIEKVLGVRV